MKNQRFLKRSKKFALGIALALGCNVLSMGMMSNAEAAVLDTQITGGTVTLTEDTTIDTFAPVDSTLYGGIQNVYSGGSVFPFIFSLFLKTILTFLFLFGIIHQVVGQKLGHVQVD